MDTFALALLSFSFKALIVLFPFMLILKILRNLYIDKSIKALIELPEEHKGRLIRLYRSAISTWKIFFWVMPLLLIMPCSIAVFLLLFPRSLPSIMEDILRQLFSASLLAVVVGYIHILEDTFYKKKILKAIDKST